MCAQKIRTLRESGVGIVTCTLNAEVADDNQDNIDYVGFVWDTASRANPGDTAPDAVVNPYANNWVSALGDYGQCRFSRGISSLVAATTYYWRPCAHFETSNVWVYGGQRTLIIPPHWPMFLLTFDDGWADFYDPGAILAHERNIKITQYHHTDTWGWGTKLNTSMAHAALALGCPVCCHSHTHTSLTTYPDCPAIFTNEIDPCNNVHLGAGLPIPEHHSYPYGHNDAMVRACIANYRATGRTVGSVFPGNWAWSDWYALGAPAGNTYAAIKTQIDNAIGANRCGLIHTHSITRGAAGDIALVDFMRILQYLNSKAADIDAGVNIDTLYRAFQGIRTYWPINTTPTGSNLQGLTTGATAGKVVDYVGFVWGTTRRGNPGDVAPNLTAYVSSWTSGAGAYAEAPFEHEIAGLGSGVEYFFRAAAHVDGVWVYGEEVTLQTPPSAVTRPASNFTAPTARAHGRITDDTGQACERRVRHKPVDEIWGDDFEWGSDGNNVNTSGGDITWTQEAAGASEAKIDANHYLRLFHDGANHPSALTALTARSFEYSIAFWARRDAGGRMNFSHGNGSKRLYLQTSVNRITYSDAGGAAQDTAFNSFVEDIWFLIELKHINWESGWFELWVDEVFIGVYEIWNNAVDNNVIRFRNLTAGTVWFDDLLVTYNLPPVEEDFEWGVDGTDIITSGGTIAWQKTVAGASFAQISTDASVSGTRCLKLSHDGANAALARFTAPVVETRAIIAYALVTAGNVWWRLQFGNGTYCIDLRINRWNQFIFYSPGATVIQDGLANNQWYLIGLANLDFESGTFSVYLDGVYRRECQMNASAAYNNQIALQQGDAAGAVYTDDVRVIRSYAGYPWTLTAFANGLFSDALFHADVSWVSDARNEFEVQARHQATLLEGDWSNERLFGPMSLAADMSGGIAARLLAAGQI